jgi:hypothetical protein
MNSFPMVLSRERIRRFPLDCSNNPSYMESWKVAVPEDLFPYWNTRPVNGLGLLLLSTTDCTFISTENRIEVLAEHILHIE